MAFDNSEKNTLQGLIFSLISALGFFKFSVSLRWRKETLNLQQLHFAGFSGLHVLLTMILISDGSSFIWKE